MAGDEARALYNLASVYFKKGLYHEAKGLLLETITINPSFETAKLLLESASTMAKLYNKTVKKELSDNHNYTVSVESDTEIITSTNEPEDSKVVNKNSKNETNKRKIDSKPSKTAIPDKPDQQLLLKSQVKKQPSKNELIVTIADNNLENEDSTKAILHSNILKGKHSIDNRHLYIPTAEKSGNINQQINMNLYGFKNGAGIEISNGNGINGMARRMGNFLRNKGYNVVRLTNADNFSHAETIIYYQMEYLHDAYHVAQQIPGYQNMGKRERFDRSNINIKVLIGKDTAPYNKMFSGGS